jgi:hypothetical protein
MRCRSGHWRRLGICTIGGDDGGVGGELRHDGARVVDGPRIIGKPPTRTRIRAPPPMEAPLWCVSPGQNEEGFARVQAIRGPAVQLSHCVEQWSAAGGGRRRLGAVVLLLSAPASTEKI